MRYSPHKQSTLPINWPKNSLGYAAYLKSKGANSVRYLRQTW